MKYIILEIIPSSFEDGDIIQFSAIKVQDFTVIDRFDYRLKEDNIKIKDFIQIISYDKDNFTYRDKTIEILKEFEEWSNNYKLLIIDNKYTENYLRTLKNEKEFINDYLNIPYTDDMIDILIKKYNLQPSNYIVDLLLESLIYESNNIK